ncbi:phosphonate transport system substrate-binding protein [Azonexus fungiphilus]|uniref:Phosphonate transport system substrate-binding protein n=1 Tax=Azonexus fungiphilus TaxID=146940 RepID=A0A495VP39_9RHOO|nr:PhnD/SsuA/transferrin family substrate-binding protein [Azonexus fungiphilus]NHC08214.1 phosphate/phosphite/phosphonate ABC transporter substrate-binding protein [Azonexus fungiphilus]RKT50690.1 phosphonate transport system substrate-binding protein [Azonexus fungiphilus]
MPSLTRLLVLLGGLLLGITAWAGPARAFSIGVAPHSSARLIIGMYQPLRQHLERTLGQPVEIVTAPDFTEFARRAMQGRFDLVITTGHQARLLQTDAGYLPLLTYQAEFRAVALVPRDSPVRTHADLDGATVFGLSPASLVTLWGEHWLHRNGIRGTSMRYVSAADSIAQLLLKGEGKLAFTSLANYQNLPPGIQSQLLIFDESLSMAGRVYLLNQRHGNRREDIEKALWRFAETPEAAEYFAQHKLKGYRRLAHRELNEMEPYANEVRKQLKLPSR